ncbi:Uncharacterised protein [Mycobacteroides abscessus subsp. abscessus]|nr:Uncharacterised protein [Mycobacteroides abscessus subsp. abscessus]
MPHLAGGKYSATTGHHVMTRHSGGLVHNNQARPAQRISHGTTIAVKINPLSMIHRPSKADSTVPSLALPSTKIREVNVPSGSIVM